MPNRRGRPAHDDVLTPAEWRTLNWVRHGLTNQQIADRRGISLDAVKFHVANIVSKLDVANRKALKTWQGAPKSAAKAEMGSDMNEDMKVLGLGQVARSVSDLQTSERWYKEVVGLDHLYTFGDLAFFDCGGARLMLSQAESKPGDESLIYLRVPDIHATHQRLLDDGVEFLNAPHMIHRHEDGTEEWMAFFKDPDGRPIGIMSVSEDGPGSSA